MKKILFVLCRAGIGGSCKSLMNLITALNNNGSNEYDINVFLMDHSGENTETLSKITELLPKNILMEANVCSYEHLKSRKLYAQILIRAFLRSIGKIIGHSVVNDYISRNTAKQLSGFDTVVSFQEESTTFFTSYINTNNKIAWVHNNVETFIEHSGYEKNKVAYDQYNKIVCVSEAARNSFLRYQLATESSLVVINNLQNVDEIIQRSNEQMECFSGGYKLVSVGRLSKQKSFTRIPRIAKALMDKGFKFSWLIVGDGGDRNVIEEEIVKLGLTKYVTLTGMMMNPFPIIKAADLLVVTSLYEANPMVVSEANILGVPVITTDYESAHEFIKEGENGVICENTEDGILSALISVLNDSRKLILMKNILREYVYPNQTLLAQIEGIL